jgi:hypothetical protein
MLNTRSLFVHIVIAVGGIGMSSATSAADGPVIEVFKTAICQCCRPWVKQLEAAGFQVKVTDFEVFPDVEAIKRQHGIPEPLSSCHTALVDEYVIEGHVSVDEIRRLLTERPKVVGLAVPGMPKGAPGMETDDPERYEVLALDPDGKTWVFATHEPARKDRDSSGQALQPATDPASANSSPGPR